MNFLRRLFGIGGVDKYDLIRELAKLRIKSDSRFAELGADAAVVDRMSSLELLGLPESTIVAIVETWAALTKRGVAERDILMRVEGYRSQFFGGGELPEPLTLDTYIRYRVQLESRLRTGLPLSDDFIEQATRVAKQKYTNPEG